MSAAPLWASAVFARLVDPGYNHGGGGVGWGGAYRCRGDRSSSSRLAYIFNQAPAGGRDVAALIFNGGRTRRAAPLEDERRLGNTQEALEELLKGHQRGFHTSSALFVTGLGLFF